MDGAMGQEEDVVEAVLTCEGDFHDPELASRLERFRHRLKDLLLTEKHKLHVKKIEPWNSVKVTFTIPRDAAIRLRQLAQNGSEVLKQMGVRSVQIQGDSQISLTIAGQSSQSTNLIVGTPPSSQCSNSSLPSVATTDTSTTSSDECGPSRIPTKDEVARRNIMDYFKHGSALRNNVNLFDTVSGSGASPVSTVGVNFDVAESLTSLPGQSGSSTFIRFNNIATTGLPSPTVGGPQISSGLPMKKITGAFHPAIPQLSSMSHNSATNFTQQMQSNPMSSHPETHLSNVESSVHGFPHSFTTTSYMTPLRSSLSSSSTNYNPQLLHSTLSSSPTSNFMKDLPPPPPYPHKLGSLSQLGKPVTASSPMLINLLQTDPMAAAALLAKNKSTAARDNRSGSPFKKKRHPRNATDELGTSYLFNERTENEIGSHSRLITYNTEDVSDTVSYSEHTVSDSATDLFSVNLAQHRPEDVFVSDMQDYFMSGFHADIKPSFSPDNSGHNMRVHSGSRSDTLPLKCSSECSKSAIETQHSHCKLSDSIGLKMSCSVFDPLTMESAAGKIINPYTGHLEPRESEDYGQIRMTESSVYQGENYAAQMVARTAKERNNYSVPTTCSLLDVHVAKTTFPSPFPCTAAIYNSGRPLQTSSGKWKPVSTQASSSVGNLSFRVADESISLPNIYAVNEKPWHELVNSTDEGCKYLFSSVTKPSDISSSVSITHQKSFADAHMLHNGPVARVQGPKHNIGSLQHQPVTASTLHNVNLSQHQHITSYISGTGPSIPESVIYSSMALPLSLSLPISRHIHMTQGQQTATPAAVIHSSFPPTLQSLAPSSMTLASKLVSSCTSSHLSVLQATERWKATCSSHLSPRQQSQAANCNQDGDCNASKLSTSNLLNSLRGKHIDSLGSIESPPDIKASSDGDENSCHNGLFTDNLPEQSGATTLLEHCHVKVENHDSGVGSSSERSDDTPSEPGDGEFRSGQIVAENEDIGKTSNKKTCKMELKVNSNLNAATVGYTRSSLSCTSQPKLTYVNDSNQFGVVNPTPELQNSHVFPPHSKSLDKQTEHFAASPRISSMSMLVVDGEGHSSHNYADRLRDNGQSTDKMDTLFSGIVNGPSMQVCNEKMSTSDKQQKKRSLPKHKDKKGLMEVQTGNLKLQAEMFEKISKLNHYAQCTNETSSMLTKTSSFDKSESPDALTQQLKALEDRPDQYIFDMEDLINGKTIGHGAAGVDSRGGSNITSIYSKRSSPVNVNMLNHIYAPGLPLPRRLTESVQRLVKPLPASETSVIAPQMRMCKSPVSGMSPRAGSINQNFTRMSNQSGVRSLGGNGPKLGPADIHSFMSSGFDLASLSSLASTQTDNTEQTGLSSAKVTYRRESNMMPQDILFQESHLSPRQNPFVNNQFDTKLHSSKTLSQSFPTCKFIKDLTPSTSHVNHDLLLGSSTFEKNNCSVSLPAVQDSLFSNSMMETQNNKSHQDSLHSSHIPTAFLNTIQFLQQSTATECTHSSVTNQDEENFNVFTSHSSLPISPVMPNLQQRQAPQLTCAMSSSISNISSHSLFCPATENLPLIGSSIPSSCATVTNHNKHVPYSNNLVNVPSMAVITTAKETPVFASLPSVPAAPTVLETMESQCFSAAPTLSHSSISTLAHEKLKNVFTSRNPSQSSPRSGSHIAPFSRNLFESVSGTLNCGSVSGTVNCGSISKRTIEHYLRDTSVEQVGHGELPLCISPKDSYSLLLDKVAAVIVSQSGRVDIPKVGVPVHNSLELPNPASPLAGIINFEMSKMPQTCDVSYSNRESSNDSNCSKVTMKTNSLVSSTLQESEVSESIEPLTVIPSSVVSGVSHAVGTASTVLASTKEESPKLVSSLSVTGILSVTEPSLTNVVSAELILTRQSQAGLGDSVLGRKELNSKLHQRETDIANESALVVTQNGPHRLQDYSLTQPSAVVATMTAHKSRTLIQTLIHKRKYSQNEDELFPTESVPGKPLQLARSISLVNSTMGETAHSISDGYTHSDGTDTHEWTQEKNHNLSKISTNVTNGSHEKQGENTKNRTNSPQVHGDKDGLESYEKFQSFSTSEDKEQTSSNNPYQLVTSGTVENQINRQSLSESIDLLQKENMAPHYISIISGESGIDECIHLMDTGPTAAEDKDLPKDGLCDGTMSVVHKENTHIITMHKDIGCHQGELCDEHDGHESNSNCTASLGDKITSGMDAHTEKTVLSDKELHELKLDEGLKKSNRIKRQFYAYIPEKSIDQTYFDAPILSGRTRSKNKPNDLPMQDTTLTEDKSALITNTMESLSYHSVGGHQVTAGKIDDVFDGKRPSRSIKAKDNSQDSSTSKRRRLQHI